MEIGIITDKERPWLSTFCYVSTLLFKNLIKLSFVFLLIKILNLNIWSGDLKYKLSIYQPTWTDSVQNAPPPANTNK